MYTLGATGIGGNLGQTLTEEDRLRIKQNSYEVWAEKARAENRPSSFSDYEEWVNQHMVAPTGGIGGVWIAPVVAIGGILLMWYLMRK